MGGMVRNVMIPVIFTYFVIFCTKFFTQNL